MYFEYSDGSSPWCSDDDGLDGSFDPTEGFPAYDLPALRREGRFKIVLLLHTWGFFAVLLRDYSAWAGCGRGITCTILESVLSIGGRLPSNGRHPY